jgi:hypothetical protein
MLVVILDHHCSTHCKRDKGEATGQYNVLHLVEELTCHLDKFS